MFSLLLTWLISLPAGAALPCPTEQIISDGVVASRFLTLSLGCVVQVTPREKAELRYREYWIDERGRFLVFVSVPGDDADKFTGTRSYFLFPRKQNPAFSWAENGDIKLAMVSGHAAVFAGGSGKILGFPGEILEDPAVNLENEGGLEIKSFEGIRLDSGWKLGKHAYNDPSGSSIFSDAHNSQCKVRNDEFFFYEQMYYDEPNFRFPDDASLAKFLEGRCPNLDLAPLKSGSPH